MKSLSIEQINNFSMSAYFQAVVGLLGRPKQFFSDLPDSMGIRHALGFLTVSAIFSSAAGMINTKSSSPLIAAGIYLINAVGMVFILAGLGYTVMVLSTGKKVVFARVFIIYALASSVTLLVSWVPYLLVITEPWKWWLIGIGMVKACRLQLGQSIRIIGLSLGIWILLFWALIPLTMH